MTALATLPSTDPSTGCRLVALDGRPLPLTHVAVSADAGGGLARVVLRQTFVNPYPEPLAATYLLPLPADGAVVDFSFTIGGRRIAGRVERKADARAAFAQAVVEGRTAALLEQDRSSVFTQELGNLPPGVPIEVEIEVEQLLAWVNHGWEWRWPTVVGPRFMGAAGQVPDAAKVTVPVADQALPVRCEVVLAIRDTQTGAVTSPSHAVTARDTVHLDGALDRDIVVRWPVAAPEPGVRIEVAHPVGDADAYGLLTVVPPASTGTGCAPVSRDLCLLLDVSGSMGGAPLDQLRRFSTELVDGLRDGDQLEMIAFASAPERWVHAPVRIDATTRAQARRWIAGLSAGGGTAMHDAVIEALAPLRADAARQVVLMTDGYIGFEQQVIRKIRERLPAGSRIHAVGVGSSVNRTLTTGVARAGGGVEAIVSIDEPVDDAVRMLLARTGDPLWVAVQVTGTAVREVAPAAVPDLLAGCPARIVTRLDPAGGTVVVSARTATGTTRHELQIGPVSAGSGRRVLATRFARERVEDLETALSSGETASLVDAAIEALGLRHRIATRLTSWVAATEEATVDAGDPTRHVDIPHELPHGVSAEGVGLRPAIGGLVQEEEERESRAGLALGSGRRMRRKMVSNAAPPPPPQGAPGGPPRPIAPSPARPSSVSKEKADVADKVAKAESRTESTADTTRSPAAPPAAAGAADTRSLKQRLLDRLTGRGPEAPPPPDVKPRPEPSPEPSRAPSPAPRHAPAKTPAAPSLARPADDGTIRPSEGGERADADQAEPVEAVALEDREAQSLGVDAPFASPALPPRIAGPGPVSGKVRTLTARVVSDADGKLVLEVTFDAETPWDPDTAVAFASDGAHAAVPCLPGTTRSGTYGAGQRARLVIAWTGAPPSRITLDGLHLVVERR